MAKLARAHVMIAQEMVGRGSSVRQVAAQLGVDESTLRYHLKRPADGPDGRRDRAATTMLKLSGLPPGETLEGFDWRFQPGADRRQLEALPTCRYLREKTNVLPRSCTSTAERTDCAT
jgi:hypothetical protein